MCEYPGAYLTRAAEVHQMYHSPVEFEKFFEFARRGRVHTEQKHLVSDIATARCVGAVAVVWNF